MTVDLRRPGIGTAFRNFDYEEEIARLKRAGGGGGGTGPAGPVGPTGYDTAPIGAVITTTRSTWSNEYVLANGQSLTEVVYPDACVVAAAEVAAGNPLWTVTGSAPNRSFTIPDLRDRFIYSSGARALGILSQSANPAAANYGKETHTLLSAEAAQKAVSTGNDTPDHTHALSPSVPASPGQVGAPGSAYVVGGSTIAVTQGASIKHTHPISGSDATTPHNNMPPYAVLVFIVKVKGVSTSATVIQGPTGAQGAQGAQGPVGAVGPQGPVGPTGGNATVPMDGWHTVGAAGEPAFQNSWVNNNVSTTGTLQFRKDPLGKVQMRGAIKSGTLGSVVCTLPVGYRPPIWVSFMSYTSATTYAAIQVAPDGNVWVAYRNDIADMAVVEFDTDTVTQMPTGPQGPAGPSTPFPRVTTLPGSPVDGQEVYLVASAGPPAVVWHMRYNATIPKWEFVGGPPITFLMEGSNNGYVGFAAGTNITINAAQTTALQWNITPLIDVWVEVEFHIGIVQKVDANYHYAVFNTMVAPAPASGTPAQALRTQHASVNVYEPYIVRSVLGLNAGVAYAIYCQTSIQGGTWQYNQNPYYLHLDGKAWPR